jgi:hypothetical protein
MSTLTVVEEILRETQIPMSVREIVERAGPRLPSKSKTPDTVVARDLSMDIKRKGDASLFVRSSPGRYTLRALCADVAVSTMVGGGTDAVRHAASVTTSADVGMTDMLGMPDATSVLPSPLRVERAAPLAARKQTQPGDDGLAAAPAAPR